MKKYLGWIVVGVLILAVVASATWASSQTPMVARGSETWSRGKIVGQTPVKRYVALEPAPDGGALLVWQNMADQLQLMHIGPDGDVILDRPLSVGAKEPRDPQLQVGSAGRLHLIWREGEHPHSVLYYVLLNSDGTPVSQPQALSVAPILENPQLVSDSAGRYHAVWADDDGIRWAVLDAEGTLLRSPILLVSEEGIPAVQMDEAGRLHLTWRSELRTHVWAIKYAVLDPDGEAINGGVEVGRVILRSGQGVDDPVLGLTSDRVYVLWEVQDFKYSYSWCEYATFPVGYPEQAVVDTLSTRLGQNPLEIRVVPGVRESLLLTLSESVLDSDMTGVARSQVAALILGQREEIVTASRSASLKPVLVEGEDGYFHMAWLETAKFGRYRVTYASTAPRVLESYNALTSLDVLDSVFSGFFKVSTLVVSLIAALIMWALIPLIVLVLFHVFTSEEMLVSLRSWVVLVIVLATVVFLTFAVPPRLGVETEWAALRWVAPSVGAVVATAVVLNTIRRREYLHLFGVYFTFVGVNSLTQMLLYLFA